MELTHILAFNLALFAAMISPGPAFLVVVQNTLSSGRRAGSATGFGLACVAALWTTAALLGLDVVFTLFPWAYVVVKTIGALYLLYVAYATWQSACKPVVDHAKPMHHAFRQGLMVNALNPKSVLFAAAVLVVIFPSNMSLLENGFIIANHLILEIIFYTALAFFMSRPAVSKGYLAAKLYIDRCSAVALGLLGGRLLIGK
ncbi:Threonine/homoserine/homoserine lactone efflux protein [Epibacterium ulvae]|uniref:Threonine/homoserine/homoserine lactone efflux protein n=1 Tax=Epibacterium ulvae TaxID=1156985 RepID=A0A1G5PX01_9RHOB|nr:LysE family transporter [Epibacterium ulvae]SCZ53756.1 Threonine/homoserine/homoserine lactone efflux protein [Epibacterium ulvae]